MTIQPVCKPDAGGVWDGRAFWYANIDEKSLSQSPLQRDAYVDALSYAFYVALPATDSGMILDEVLATERALPLCNLLLKNEASTIVKDQAKEKLQELKQCMPLVGNPVAAMSLAFFAFQPELEDGMRTKPMHLHTFRTVGLPGGCAPLLNPLCSYWLTNLEHLCESLKKGRATLTTQPWQMAVHQTGDWKPHQDIIEANSTDRLKDRKRMLEYQCADLAESLEVAKKQKAEVEKQLAKIKTNSPNAASTSASTQSSQPSKD